MIITELISLGADLNMPSRTDGATALYYAAGAGRDKLVAALASAGASVSQASTTHGGFPLLYAALQGHLSTVRALLRYNDSVAREVVAGNNLTAFLAAVANGHTAVVSEIWKADLKLLNRQVTRERPIPILYSVGPKGQSALHLASAAGDDKMVDLIINLVRQDKTIEPARKLRYLRLTDENGAMAVHAAVRSSKPSLRVVQSLTMLLRELVTTTGDSIKGSEDSFMCPRMVSDLDKSQFTASPLYLAIVSAAARNQETAAEIERMASYLLSIGCDPNLVVVEDPGGAELQRKDKGKGQRTPLLAAVDRNLVPLIRIMLEGVDRFQVSAGKASAGPELKMKADPDRGIPAAGILSSPLLFAVARNKHQIADLLLLHNASCALVIQTPSPSGSVDSIGETLIDLSRRLRHFDTLQVLTRYPQCDPDTIRQYLKGGEL
jgi:hypothetical protein